MNEKKLDKRLIQSLQCVPTWEEAIRIAATPLLQLHYIKEGYIEAMIQTVIDLGSYIVIAPNIAMPHARNDGDVLQNAFSILKLKEPINFGTKEDSKVTLIIPIACVDNEHHLTMLANLATILSDEKITKQLFAANDIQDIYAVFEHISFEEEAQ